jgi:hypothetical protein
MQFLFTTIGSSVCSHVQSMLSLLSLDDLGKQSAPALKGISHSRPYSILTLFSRESRSHITDMVVGEMRLKLSSAILIFDKWLSVPKKLTQSFWTSGTHPWKGLHFEDRYLSSYRSRLQQVTGVLTVADELLQVLAPNLSQLHSNLSRLYPNMTELL